MGIAEILSQIDREISLLEQARSLLNSTSAGTSRGARSSESKAPAKKRKLSPEGRRRIAEAVKRRWAEQRKNSGKSASTK